jgi:hypothetical protein
MRSVRTLLAIGCVLVLVLVLATCSKNQRNESLGQIGDVTYSKNFSGQLTDANIWVERNTVFHDATTKQIVADKKEILEEAFKKALKDLEHATHEIYFKYLEVATQPLEFKVTVYVTPAPKKVLSGTQSIETDPPPSTTPPPPLQ